jgi:hypothetical protein
MTNCRSRVRRAAAPTVPHICSLMIAMGFDHKYMNPGQHEEFRPASSRLTLLRSVCWRQVSFCHVSFRPRKLSIYSLGLNKGKSASRRSSDSSRGRTFNQEDFKGRVTLVRYGLAEHLPALCANGRAALARWWQDLKAKWMYDFRQAKQEENARVITSDASAI